MNKPILPNFIYIDFEKHGRIHQVRKSIMRSFTDCFRLGESGSDHFLSFIKSNEAKIVHEFNQRLNNDVIRSPFYHYKYILDCDYTLHIAQKEHDNWDEVSMGESKSYVISITAITVFAVIAMEFYRNECFEYDTTAVLVDESRIDSFDLELLSKSIYQITGTALLFTGRHGIFAGDIIY